MFKVIKIMAEEKKSKKEETGASITKKLNKKLAELEDTSFKNAQAIHVRGKEAVKNIVKNNKRRRNVKLIKPKGLKGLQTFMGAK